MTYPTAARLSLTLFVTLVCCLPAGATVRPEGARIRWVGERPAPARAGRDVRGRFEVVAARPGMLENVRVEGSGWTVQPVAAGRSVMTRGQRRGFDFTARPSRENEPLVVSATFDGREIRETVRLDEASLAPRKLRFKDGPPRVSGAGRREAGAEPRRTQTTAFHFTGRFSYVRGGPNPIEVGADNIVVKIWDEDDIVDELIWQGSTDVNGYFDVNVNWDDCDLSGCDDPDLYLEFIAQSAVVDVQTDDAFETTYSWQSAVMNDFTGNTVAFGTMMPNDSGEYGAVSVYTGVMRAARFAADHGMTPPMVDCQWPDDDGSFYSQYFEEMHIKPGDEWNEGTQTHEFGHHLNNIYGNMAESNYENGYCDTPDPSHCLWCPENDQDAWQEGWANWFGSVVNRNYQDTYGIIPVSINDNRYTLEMTDGCTDHGPVEHWPGPYTEGFIGAILRDIEDSQNDDHDGGLADCDMDAMALGADEIMTVFRDDDPTDIAQFITGFRNRYEEHDQDLWSTLRNVWSGFGFPLPAPEVVSQPQNCVIARVGDAVTLSVTGDGSLLKYQWRRDGAPMTEGVFGASGTQTKNLTLSPLGLVTAGTFDCLVTTCDGTLSVLSQSSRITVLPATTQQRLVSWGENLSYQAGDGTNTWHIPPYAHTSQPHMIQVEGGRSHTVALATDGIVYTWGDNGAGQLGSGAWVPTFRSSPAPSLISNAIQVAAGHGFTMALRKDGTLFGAGDNFRGQLGDSTFDNRTAPVDCGEIGGCVIAVSCGETHTIGLRADGTVYGWGNNVYGCLGRGFDDGQRYSIPAPVVGLTNVVAISAAGYMNLALKADGTVWAWGYNASGQLGIGPSAPAIPTPTQINGLPAIRSVIAGGDAGFAIGVDGSAWSWGWDYLGFLGAGSSIGGRNTPGAMALVNPLQIVAGEGHWGAAVMSDRTVRVWGYNAEWINGSSTPLAIYSPMPVPGVVRVSSIGAGYGTVHALGDIEGVTDVPREPDVPTVLALGVSPNPSFAATRISFDLPRASQVSLAIYDLAGRRVHTVVEGMRDPGRYQEAWDGRTEGRRAVAGVYFARLEAGGETRTERLVRIR